MRGTLATIALATATLVCAGGCALFSSPSPPPDTDDLTLEDWVARELPPGTAAAAAIALLEKRGFAAETKEDGRIVCRFDQSDGPLVTYVHGVILTVENGKVAKTETLWASYGP